VRRTDHGPECPDATSSMPRPWRGADHERHGRPIRVTPRCHPGGELEACLDQGRDGAGSRTNDEATGADSREERRAPCLTTWKRDRLTTWGSSSQEAG